MRLKIPTPISPAPVSLALMPLIPLVLGTAALAAEAARPASLAVSVTGLHSTKGKIIACLWRDKAGFPSCAKSKTAQRITLPVSGATMQLNFPDLTPGRYAVTVEHDEDGDGKMGRNFIGMPTEGVGASNNPGGMPGFEKSLVTVGAGSAIMVRIKYLFG